MALKFLSIDTSGRQTPITFDPGDELAQVSGYTGNWFGRICVCQISLKTRNGKVYWPYGNMNNVSGATPFNYAAQAGQSILAFSGSLVNVPLAGGAPNVDIIQSLGLVEG